MLNTKKYLFCSIWSVTIKITKYELKMRKEIKMMKSNIFALTESPKAPRNVKNTSYIHFFI